MGRKIFCDGIPGDSNLFSSLVHDTSFQRGYAAFELFRTYQRKPFKLDEHLNRLEKTCRLLHIPLLMEKEVLKNHIASLQFSEETCIRIYVTVGSERSIGHVYVLTEPVEMIPQGYYEEGIHAITSREKRFLPEGKSTNYSAAQHALRSTSDPRVKEVIFLDESGAVLEGGTSNIFGVKNGILYTAPEGVLSGVTRNCIATLFADQLKWQSFHIHELDECFLTGSLREVMPITVINGKPVGNGCVGQKTREVIRLFQEYTIKQKTNV